MTCWNSAKGTWRSNLLSSLTHIFQNSSIILTNPEYSNLWLAVIVSGTDAEMEPLHPLVVSRLSAFVEGGGGGLGYPYTLWVPAVSVVVGAGTVLVPAHTGQLLRLYRTMIQHVKPSLLNNGVTTSNFIFSFYPVAHAQPASPKILDYQ